MSATLEGMIVAVLAIWLMFSVLNQFALDFMAAIKRRDYFGLIPRWTFFAPNPASTDYHLIFRDRLQDGRVTEWRAAALRREKRLQTAVWNPGKRRQKALADFMRSLSRNHRGSRGNTDALQLSLAYIALLHVTSTLAEHDDGAESTQFAVVQTYGFVPRREPRLIMHSRFHGVA